MSARRAWVLLAAAVMSFAGSKDGFTYNGMNHVSWQVSEYTVPAGAASRDALIATGDNWVSVLVTWYQDTITSTVIAPNGSTPSDAALIGAIQELHAKGVKVMLKPHVDVLTPGRWRGEIAPPDPDAWFSSYTPFIVKYAQMAQDQGVEGLIIGTELVKMSGAAHSARWNAVIDAIRAVYSGTLTYAANATSAGDEFTSVSFWDRLDLIGLDGYFPLTGHADPTLAELVAAWRRNRSGQDLVAAVKNFADSRQKPVIFTEIGYRSAAGANMAPWDYSVAAPYDPTEQRDCYDAFYTVWSQQASWVKGVFWWDWSVYPPGPADIDYTPRGKPAEAIMRDWQAPLPGTLNAVVGAASYLPGTAAPGGIVSLWGAGLASETAAAPSFPLPTTLGNTTVTFNGTPAPLFFVSPGQINAQLPFELAPGSVMAEVTSNTGVARLQFTVAPAGPGIFSHNAQGTGEGAFLDAVTFRLITAADPAAPGEWLQIYCTGLGAVTQPVTTGAAVPVPPPRTVLTPQVLIDGQPLTADWSGLASGWVGLYAVNVQLPATLSPGVHQIQLSVNGAVSNTVTLAVH